MPTIYLDNNASAPLLSEVRDYLRTLLDSTIANPSSPHALGAEARKLVEKARYQVANALEVKHENVLFVSSGSEANTMALCSVNHLLRERGTIVTTLVEHSSVRRSVEFLEKLGFTVVTAAVKSNGVIDIDQLEKLVTTDTAIVSVQWVNNETGVIQPVAEISDISHRAGALFHCDAAQAFGKLAFSGVQEKFDLISVTSHKIGGPQGCGALYVRDPHNITPIIGGGEQEYGLRGGTENVIGIAGFGLAAELRTTKIEESIENMQKCRDAFEHVVRSAEPEVKVNGCINNRVCNTSNLCFRGADGRVLLAQLDKEGIFCSQSSACTTGRPEPSYVLRSMGLSEDEAYSSIRFSFGFENSVKEALWAAEQVVGIYQKTRGLSQLLQY